AGQLGRLRSALTNVPLIELPYLFSEEFGSDELDMLSEGLEAGVGATGARARGRSAWRSASSLTSTASSSRRGTAASGRPPVAASIALWGALQGRRAVALTIDPARRLATSLGLETLGGVEREIPKDVFDAQGLHPRGTLAASMLDQKGAWDALVERHAPPEAR